MSEQFKEQKPKKETWFTRFIDAIAAANDKKFGGQTPDCCGGTRNPKDIQRKH